MNLWALRAELDDDPLGRGYSGMTDVEAAADLNTVYRSRDKASVSGSEILNGIVVSEWNALTDAQRQTVWDIVHLGEVNPFGIEATLMVNIFGAGSETISGLSSLRTEDISRAQELGLPQMKPGYVERARAL